MKLSASRSKGLTLIELLIVISILAILIFIAMMSWRNQIAKARDSQKKDDLSRLSIAIEEYFSDNNCYPQENILDNCSGSELSPYLESIPCDPVTGQPYCYIPDTDNPSCPKNFRALTPLQNDSDSSIADLGCDGNDYCGWEDECATPTETGFNYGISSTDVPVANPSMPSPPTPSPSPPPGPIFACDPYGVCNVYADPDGNGCPATFPDPDTCQAACDASPDNWCTS